MIATVRNFPDAYRTQAAGMTGQQIAKAILRQSIAQAGISVTRFGVSAFCGYAQSTFVAGACGEVTGLAFGIISDLQKMVTPFNLIGGVVSDIIVSPIYAVTDHYISRVHWRWRFG